MAASTATITTSPSLSTGTRGIFRVKQAGRTGIGTVMSDKKIQAIVVLADNPAWRKSLWRR